MEVELELGIPGNYVKERKDHKNGKRKSYIRKLQKRRLISKKGTVNVMAQVPGRPQLYLADHFTTLIDARWRYVFLIFTVSFLVSWLVFGSIWWGVYVYRKEYFNVECIEKVDSWTSAFLFSLETQTTIGYGGRQVTPHCPEGVFLLIVQCIVGLLISSTMLGLIFAKLSRPHLRGRTVLFSNHAVIALRDGKMCMMFRVGDLRTKSQLIEAHIRAVVIRRHCTKEGKEIGFFQQGISLRHDLAEEGEEKINLFIPAVVAHVIDENSPFYNCSADNLLRLDFEVVLILEGIVESTGMTTQARSSYISDEVHWGHNFTEIVTQNCFKNGAYHIDYSTFHDTYPVETPRCSARELDQMQSSNSSSGCSSNCPSEIAMTENRDERPPIDLTAEKSQDLRSRSGFQLIPNGNLEPESAITRL